MNTAPTQLDNKLREFINKTAKSKVAVVIPMYGYWKDAPSDQLNHLTIKLTLDRLYSSVHQLYIVFVSEAPRLPDEVASLLVARAHGGNTSGVLIKKRGATYADYLREGIKVALETTDAQFIVNLNPWVLLQHNALDILIDRVNTDDAQIACGFDVRGAIEPKSFDNQSFTFPKEIRDLSFDFVGMRRSTAETIVLDDNYRTHGFLARDLWQRCFVKGFESITTQRVPIFPFDVDWKEFETSGEHEADKQYFVNKWKYDPSIEYGK